MSALRDLLEKEKVIISSNKGKVTLMQEDDEGNEKEFSLEALGYTEVSSYIDSHPEGSDRGGYVPYVEAVGPDKKHYNVYYYEHDGWIDTY
jgi:hypothetical protein